ncbi:MAG: hypothetical protein B7Y41_01460 [Hydrogenophilales bacterium 28-61-23]|nr:MAG: hypothetical protein B7Y41_01460 [Hydrogenophilales bacterium 28-61-23]
MGFFYSVVRSMDQSQTICPSCGGPLKTKKTIRFSLADLIGVTFVCLFLLSVLAVVAHILGPWGLAYAAALVVFAWFLVRRGGAKALGQPANTSGLFAEGWLLGGVLFLLGATVRFFFRWQFQKRQVCSQCGYKSHVTE